MKSEKNKMLVVDINSLRRCNRQYVKTIELQRERLEDLETLVEWSSRRNIGETRRYVLCELERNKNMKLEEK